MATIVRRKRLSRRELGLYKRHELLTGEIDYPIQGYTGYGDSAGTDLAVISDEMRADWARHREELLRFWASGEYTCRDTIADSLPWLFVCGRPGTTPWAAQQFDRDRSTASKSGVNQRGFAVP